MSDPTDSKDDGRTETEADAEAEGSEPSQPKPEKKKHKEPAAGSAAKPGKKSREGDAGRGARTKPAPKSDAQRMVVAAVLALAVGGAGGWFGHEAQARAKLRGESVPAAAGSGAPSGACGDWEKKICAGSGDESAACQQAKGAADLLTTSTCEAALETIPATLAKVKAGRAPCDKLIDRLCKELPQGSSTCQMVKDRSASFPPERCEEMLANYEQVAEEIKMIEQQGLAQGAAPPHGMPPMPPMPEMPAMPPPVAGDGTAAP